MIPTVAGTAMVLAAVAVPATPATADPIEVAEAAATDEPPAPISAATAAAACPPPIGRVLSSTAGEPGTVALTFDDGPHPRYTAQVLDVLRAHGVRATFFPIGTRVVARPELVRRTAREGHVFGNHTWSHPTRQKGADMDTLPVDERASQMDRMTAALHEAAGVIPCFYRSPQGAHRSTQTQALARERGMTVVHWGPSSLDAFQTPYADPAAVRAIVERSTDPLRERPIVLLHDGGPDSGYRGNTVTALPEIIRFYERHGYAFTDPAGRVLPRTTPRIRITTDPQAEAGRDIEVAGRSWALRVGTEVRLEVRRGEAWRTVASSTIDATNAFRVSLPSPDAGSMSLRVITRGAVGATSNLLEVEAVLPPGLRAATARSVAPACPDAATADPGFLDVAPTSVHAPSIHCLVRWQVAAGTSPNSYSPGAAVTRAQMATFVARYVTATGGVFPDDPPTGFLDTAGDLHAPAIDRLAAAGIVHGRDGRYEPAAAVTRAQMASYLVRAHEYRTGQPLVTDGRHFFDTPGTTHAEAIDRAAALGVVSGVAAHRYAPHLDVRRDQMASFIARLLAAAVDQGAAPPP